MNPAAKPSPNRSRKTLEALGVIPMLLAPVVFWFLPPLAGVLFFLGLPLFMVARIWKWAESDD